MITNVHRAKASGDIQRYIRYTIAPEKDQKNPNYKHGERTLALESDYVSIGSDFERNRTSNHITDQFIAWNEEKRAGNTKPKSPAVLGVISFSASDTEKFYSTTDNGTRYLDHQKIIAVAREAVSETMGGDRPMYFALHGDKEHLHVHFAASMVNSQGKIYDGSKMVNEEGKTVSIRDFRKWEMTNETLEQKYDLEKVSHRKAFEHQGEHRQSQVARLSNSVLHLSEKGEIAPSLDLASRLDLAYKNCNKQFDQFLEIADKSGIRIKPNMNTTKINGLAFACDEMDGFIKASDLGNRYKWTKLSKDLNYDHSRDYQKLAGLKAAAERASSTPTQNQFNIGITNRLDNTINIATGTNTRLTDMRTVSESRDIKRDSRDGLLHHGQLQAEGLGNNYQAIEPSPSDDKGLKVHTDTSTLESGSRKPSYELTGNDWNDWNHVGKQGQVNKPSPYSQSGHKRNRKNDNSGVVQSEQPTTVTVPKVEKVEGLYTIADWGTPESLELVNATYSDPRELDAVIKLLNYTKSLGNEYLTDSRIGQIGVCVLDSAMRDQILAVTDTKDNDIQGVYLGYDEYNNASASVAQANAQKRILDALNARKDDPTHG